MFKEKTIKGHINSDGEITELVLTEGEVWCDTDTIMEMIMPLMTQYHNSTFDGASAFEITVKYGVT